jgi:hypothetical protein
MHDRTTTATFHAGFSGLRKLVHFVTFMSGDRDAFQKPARQVAATVVHNSGHEKFPLNSKANVKKMDRRNG